MKLVEIGKLCKLQNGKAFKPTEWSDKGLPIVRIQNLNNEEKPFNYCDFDVDKKFHIDSGDLLFSWSGTPGTSFGAFFWHRGPAILNQHIFNVLIDESLVRKDYFRLAMNAKLDEIIAQAHGGVGLQHITKGKLEAVKIPLPPLETQKQIAAVLEKADQLRKDCLQMEQELNSLAQSVFIDMFGDPVTNPKGWDMKALSDLAIIVTGNTPSRAKPEYYGSYIEWIKSGNINTPSDYLTIAEEYLSESGKKVGRVVQSGSVLMTCIAGSPDCIGNVAIADREVAFNQQINALVPIEKKLNTDFLYILLKVAKKIIQSASTNSMKGMISKSKLESIQLPFPSYDEQCDFSAIYRKLQKVVKEQQEQVIETELMFNSLMQKAFKGELTL
ncbi:restriction endonuclease subunit S [Vibrio vulnificus]|nr:restriction endonuclease subunit S [Vibrio vulnificus]